MALSTYLQNALLNHVLRNTAFTTPGTNVWVALYTANPTAAGGGTEVTGGSYARVQVEGTGDWDAPSGGVTQNTNAIVFPAATGDWGIINSFAVLDNTSGGNFLFWGWLSTFNMPFTAANAGDVFTAYAHGLINDDQVVFQNYPGDTNLPTGITGDTLYYVISSTTNTFQVSTTQGGSAVTLSSNGEGIVLKVVPRTILNGDTANFAVGSLTLALY